MEIEKENLANASTPVHRPAPLKARKTPKHQLQSSVAALSAPSPTKPKTSSPRRANSVPVSLNGEPEYASQLLDLDHLINIPPQSRSKPKEKKTY